jgi:hypothetical protein
MEHLVDFAAREVFGKPRPPRTAGAAPKVPGGPPAALLASALEQLRLDGAIFFRGESRRALRSTPPRPPWPTCSTPGAERLILFHIVADGACWVAGVEGDRLWASRGDVIVVPYGDRHTIGGQAPAERVSLLTLLDPPPWDVMPLVRHGGGGGRTDLVCGYLYSEDPLFDPALLVFPSVFVVRLPAGAAAGWVQSSIAYALEATDPANPGAGSPRSATRCWHQRCRCCTTSPAGGGPLPPSPPTRRCPARCWTSASARFSAAHRSATSPSGACTLRRSCWPPQRPASPGSPGGSATIRRRPSAGPSNGPTGFPQSWRAARTGR